MIKDELSDTLSFPFPSNVAPWSEKKAATIHGKGPKLIGAGHGQTVIAAENVQSYIYDVQRTWLAEDAATGVAVIDLRNLHIQGDFSLVPNPGKFPFLDASYSTFTGSVDFGGAEFMGNAVFENTEFKKTCSFQNTKFHAAASFNNAIFYDSTSFIGAHFATAPKFHEAKLHGDTSFRNATFVRTTTERDYQAYRRLRELMHNMKETYQEGEFFVYEQRTFRHLQFVGARKKFRLSLEASVSWLYDVMCRYGQSISRPLQWLIFINVGFSGLFCLAGDSAIVHDRTSGIGQIPPAVGLTLQNLFKETLINPD